MSTTSIIEILSIYRISIIYKTINTFDYINCLRENKFLNLLISF